MADTIDNNIMQAAAELVIKHGVMLPLMHTVTITLNDTDPQVTMEGYTNDELSEHYKISVWRGEVTVLDHDTSYWGGTR
jgi:hypothetical protein